MTINNITFLSSIYPHGLLFFNNPTTTRFYFSDYLDVKLFLDSLEIDKTYVISFEFIVSWLSYDEKSPVFTLSEPILITKNSNPRVISNFISKQITKACDYYLLDEAILEMIIYPDGPGVIAKYNEINLF
jgi:hypothetical protein